MVSRPACFSTAQDVAAALERLRALMPNVDVEDIVRMPPELFLESRPRPAALTASSATPLHPATIIPHCVVPSPAP